MKYALCALVIIVLGLASCSSVKKAFRKQSSSSDSVTVVKVDSSRLVKKDSTVREVSKDSLTAVIEEKKDIEEKITETYDTVGRVVTKVTVRKDKGVTTATVKIIEDHSKITDVSVSDSADLKKETDTRVKKDETVKVKDVKKINLPMWPLWLLLLIAGGYAVYRNRKKIRAFIKLTTGI